MNCEKHIFTNRNSVQARIQAGALPARAPPKKKEKRKKQEKERERGGQERGSKEETIRSIRGKKSAEAFVIFLTFS